MYKRYVQLAHELVHISFIQPNYSGKCNTVNPFTLTGISDYDQFDQSISVLRVVGWYLSFYSNNKDLDQTPRSAASAKFRENETLAIISEFTVFLLK